MSEAPHALLIEAPHLRVMPVTALRRWSIRVQPADRAPVEQLFEVKLPLEPLRSWAGDHASVLWLGPDEWLALMQPAVAEKMRERISSFVASGFAASLIDVTDRSLGLEISGARAEWVLNAGCPLDLATEHFPPGACTRTLFGKAEVVLYRLHDTQPRYYLECWRSFVPYVRSRLRAAAAECGAGDT